MAPADFGMNKITLYKTRKIPFSMRGFSKVKNGSEVIPDMNNIPIKKTIDMLKMSDEDSQRVAKFVLNADLSLEDFRYAGDDEVRIVFRGIDADKSVPQENALQQSAPLTEMLHLVSVYHGVPVPSIIYDSTGTKKMAAMQSATSG